MHVHAQAQDEYERRLKEEMDAKLQKEREIEQLVSRVGLAQPAVMQGWCLIPTILILSGAAAPVAFNTLCSAWSLPASPPPLPAPPVCSAGTT